ncbi:MAG: class I tRNA ligase family protein, partial [Patescibacteria group bacterium]
MKNNLDKPYNPKETEDKIYRTWEKSGFFNPDNLPKKPRAKKPKTFSIIMPPPNANGSLHIGHAIFVALQDIMIRYHRMKGDKALWLPGADHAGFETQVVYDKKLEKENRSRFQIPADQLRREMWDFTQANKKTMENQLRKLGASCDWSREKFTLDKDIVEIVYQTFEKLKNDGLLYKGKRVVNWCVKHQTSLSEVEIKYQEREDPLYFIKYGPLELATVRLETKFGDTAVAVNPKDKRYRKYVGEEIEIETVLGKSKIKVIADEAVDMNFGTGAIKVTPAHDPIDFEIWQRHKNEMPEPKQVISRFGKMNELAGPYQGLKTTEARKKIEEDMIKKGLLNPSKTDRHYKHNVATCYKCGTVIEPLILDNQWFIKMTEKPRSGGESLRDAAVKAVKSGKIKFIPKRFEKI